MKKIISLIVFMNLTNLCAEEIDLDMSMGVDIGCNISCSDFNFGTLRMNGIIGGLWRVLSDATIMHDVSWGVPGDEEWEVGENGSGGSLSGAVPAVCNVVCPSDIENVWVDLSDVYYLYEGSAELGRKFMFSLGIEGKPGVCLIEASDQVVELSDGQVSFSLCGEIYYYGYIPSGNYSTTFHVTISY